MRSASHFLLSGLVLSWAGAIAAAPPETQVFVAEPAAVSRPAHAGPALFADATRDAHRMLADARVQTLLDRWQVVAAAAGQNTATWRESIGLQLGQASDATLAALGSIEIGTDVQRMLTDYQRFKEALQSDIAARVETMRSMNPKTLGSATSDLTFTPITPCRVVDTRGILGNINPFAARNYYFFTLSGTYDWAANQGGVAGAASTACPQTVLTAAPAAALMTVSVVNQAGAGTLIVWNGTNPLAQAATLNYPASGFFANNTVATYGGRTGTGPGGAVQDFGVYVLAYTSAGVAVDVVGYFFPPQATALDCTTSVFNFGSGGPIYMIPSACPSGYTQVAMSCDSDASAGQVVIMSHTNGRCGFTNSDAQIHNLTATRICCRVPGR